MSKSNKGMTLDIIKKNVLTVSFYLYFSFNILILNESLKFIISTTFSKSKLVAA